MTVSGRFTIGALAGAVGVPTSTIRYYERRGLLVAEGRSERNYRLYGEEALDRLRFVRSAQAAGFTLSDIDALLRFRAGDAAPCRKVQELITARLDQVAGQIDHLRLVHRMLGKWLEVCREAQRSGQCGVLEGLSAAGGENCKKGGKGS